MSFNWSSVPVRQIRRNAYQVALKEYEREVMAEASEKNRQAQRAVVAQGQGWSSLQSAVNNAADARRVAWEYTMQKIQGGERQREWDAQAEQGQYWQKAKETALANLAKTGELLNMDDMARERRIAEETYKLASVDFQKTGDFESAKEAERRMRLAQGATVSPTEQATEQDYQSGLVNQVAPTAEQAQAKESGLKDFWDTLWTATVTTAKQLRQSPSTVVRSLTAKGQQYYPADDKAHPYPTPKENISPNAQAVLSKLGADGARVQAQYDTWYQSHPELWKRPEWEGDVVEKIKNRDAAIKDPFYWGSMVADTLPYTLGALIAGGLGTVASGGNVLVGALAAGAYTLPLMTQVSYETALAEGADDMTSLELAAVIGPATAALEVVGELPLLLVAGGLTKAFTKKVTTALTKVAVKQAVKQGAKTTGQVILSEVFTENAQDVVANAAIQTFNENKKLFENMGDTTIRTIVGTLPFALLGGGGTVVQTRQQNKVAAYQAKIREEIEGYNTEARKADAAGTDMDVAEVIDDMAEFATQTAQEMGIEVDVEAARNEAIQAVEATAVPSAQERAPSVEIQGTEGIVAEDARNTVITDASGKPTLFYHGTSKEFSDFKTGTYQAVYFSTSREDAARYADIQARSGGTARVVEVQAALKKDGWKRLQDKDMRDLSTAEQHKRLIAEGYDGYYVPAEGDTQGMLAVFDTSAIRAPKAPQQPITQEGTTVTPTEQAVIDEESYLAQQGLGRQAMGEPGLHKAMPEGAAKQRAIKRTTAKDADIAAKRDAARKEYQAKVASGEVRPPTRTEQLISAANGNPDNEATQAARRVLDKQGITWKQAPDTSGQVIGGGVAYNAVDRLFAVPSSNDIAKSLFANQAERRIMGALTKLPGGRAIAGRVSKTSTPRETQAEQAAVDAVAVSLDIAKRRPNGIIAAVTNTIKAYFPNGDVVKHLGIDERGIARNVRPKAGFTVIDTNTTGTLAPNEVSLHINDIMEYPERFDLDGPTMKMLAYWKEVRGQAISLMKREGINLNEDWFVENYFPRMVREAHGYEFVYPRVDFTKPRQYGTALQAIDNEIRYNLDPVENIASFIRQVHLVVAGNRLSQSLKQMGEKPSARVPASIAYGREAAIYDARVAVRAEQVVQRARRGEQIPTSTIRSIRGLSQELADGIEALMQATDKKVAGAELVLQARDLKQRKQAFAAAARKEYKKALAIAQLGKPWEGEAMPRYRGLIVPEGVLKVMQEFEGEKVSKELSVAAQINDAMRTMVASMDFSSLVIQNLLLIGRPLTFAKVAAKSFQVFFHPHAQHLYFSQAENVAILQRHPDIKVGLTHEYTAGVGVLESVPKVGKFLARPLKPFERFFGFSGDMARIEMAKILEPVFVKAGQPNQVSTYVNRMTGVMNSEALGINARQRAKERLMLFAPQYTRAMLSYLGYVVQGNVTGNQAVRDMARAFGVGTAMYVATALAMGQEPQLNPSKPTFFTVKVGNRHVGIGGFMYSFLRFMTDSFQSVVSSGGNEPLDFTKFSRKDNPILKWLYSRSSPFVSLVVEGGARQDYLGFPLEDFDDWAHWLLVEHMLPIGVQEQFPSQEQEPPSDRMALLGIEAVGLRTFPVNEFYDLANQYADESYGKEWGDLYKPTKAGSYAMSDEQKRLLATHPDLNEAYEKWKPMQTRKWQAAHGLLPDDDAVNDYYARLVFNRPWDKLSRDERNQTKQYREFAEEADEYEGGGSMSTGTSPPPLR